MADLTRRAFQFHSQAIPDGTLDVIGFTGVDRLNRPFRFDLDLVSTRPDIDGAAMLSNDAWLGIKQVTQVTSGQLGTRLLKQHGVVCAFELRSREHQWYHYRATLVPRLWRLTLTTQSRIFQDMTTIDILKAVLQAAGFGDDDSQFRTSARTYPNRGYVVQYQETDLDFLNRLVELEGISYFFEHNDERACLVFADQPDAHQSIPGAQSSLTFNERSDTTGGRSQFSQESVFELKTRYRAVTAKVVLGDFDYSQPSLKLEVESAVDATASFGVTYEHSGNLFVENGLGSTYAKLRAEEVSCRKIVFAGRSDGRGLRAGALYTLNGHFSAPCNIKQLLIKVEHEATHSLPASDSGEEEAASYTNRFVAIPADVPFRPKRVTDKPVIPGTIHAKIDAAGTGQYAELDAQGRYRIRIPFDRRTDTKPAEASAPVRMMQPYAGDNMGMHAPLHKGTEVLLTHVEGDPDRPVIAGAVPNPETSSLVQAGNQSQSVWKSAGQNAIVFEDTSGAENVGLTATKDMATTVGNDHTLTITTDDSVTVGGDSTLAITGDQTITVGGTQTETVTGDRALTAGANDSHTVAANLTQSVGANHSQTIGATHSVAVAAADNLSVGASRSVTVATTDSLTATDIMLSASSSITLAVGGSSIVINSSSITLNATNITVTASTNLNENGAQITSAATGAHAITGGTVSSTASSGANAIAGAGVTISGGGSKVSLSGSSVESNC